MIFSVDCRLPGIVITTIFQKRFEIWAKMITEKMFIIVWVNLYIFISVMRLI